MESADASAVVSVPAAIASSNAWAVCRIAACAVPKSVSAPTRRFDANALALLSETCAWLTEFSALFTSFVCWALLSSCVSAPRLAERFAMPVCSALMSPRARFVRDVKLNFAAA